MTVRITTDASKPFTVVRVDGRLRSADVPDFENVCRAIEGPLCLDLSNLLLADAEGVSAIKRLAERGAQLTGVSGYIALLLELS